MKIDAFLENTKKLSWKTLAIIVGASFVLASILSSTASVLLFPKEERRRSASKLKSSFSLTDKGKISEESIKTIMKRNIFKAEGDFALEDTAERQTVAEVIKSNLPLKLKGTIFSSNPRNGIALIEFVGKRTSNSYFNDDEIVEGVTLYEVHKEKIVVNNRGQLEYIELEKKELVRRRKVSKNRAKRKYASIATSPAAKEFREEGFERKGTEIDMSKDYKARLLGPDFTKVLQDAKASPNVVGGKLRGFLLTRIREESIYRKSGLQNGDIVEEINGVMLSDTAQAIKLLNSLRNESEIELRVVRNGKPMNFVINVK